METLINYVKSLFSDEDIIRKLGFYIRNPGRRATSDESVVSFMLIVNRRSHMSFTEEQLEEINGVKRVLADKWSQGTKFNGVVVTRSWFSKNDVGFWFEFTPETNFISILTYDHSQQIRQKSKELIERARKKLRGVSKYQNLEEFKILSVGNLVFLSGSTSEFYAYDVPQRRSSNLAINREGVRHDDIIDKLIYDILCLVSDLGVEAVVISDPKNALSEKESGVVIYETNAGNYFYSFDRVLELGNKPCIGVFGRVYRNYYKYVNGDMIQYGKVLYL